MVVIVIFSTCILCYCCRCCPQFLIGNINLYFQVGFQAIAEALGLAAVKAAVAITAIIAGGRLVSVRSALDCEISHQYVSLLIIDL